MSECCGGKNTGKPISSRRYIAGKYLFILLYFKYLIILGIRAAFSAKSRHLLRIYAAFMNNMRRQVNSKKDIVIK